ncbi:unnamed protein product [Discula destructiva]
MMASSSPANPDTPVTLKVSFQGNTRRLTLPLNEVSSFALLDKIRAFLSISSDADAVFERHSDSAAAYIELDTSNNAVWKQLYRAAKAKRKLKLRVTLHESEEEEDEGELDDEETHGPKPVTVEDEPEQQGQDDAPTKAESVSIPVAGSQCFQNIDSALNVVEKALDKLHLDSESQEQGTNDPSIKSICGTPKRANFAVCCNHCDRTIPDAHYHCSTCDEGDYDLCPACVDMGITCNNADHWLLKRFVRGDFIVVSTTEKVSPKPKVPKEDVEEKPISHTFSTELPKSSKAVPSQSYVPVPVTAPRSFSITPTRTCNSCVQELTDKEFLHCLSCDDFDLCKACFSKDKHGHHPQHAFTPAVEGTPMPVEILRRLAPGRDQRHYAICDGCDSFIYGIRHKCLDCPDWDYCADCVANSNFVHPNHRFVPIYEQIANIGTRAAPRPCHYGICCDGPLCNGSRKTYIVGERYKCAVCHDTDFCANCEASPANTHNQTHPLIKFKTPVRRVEVKTKGEDENGQKMPVMGDRLRPKAPSVPTCSTPVACQQQQQEQQEAQQKQANAQASFELQRQVIEAQRRAIATTAAKETPIAIFERDTVADGTIMPPNQVFEQTWVLRNGGDIPWPAGCSVKFVGGDYMGHIDSSHPAGIHDLVSASESTVCYDALAPGQEFPFTVLLRTPAREGKFISYWRLQSDSGLKFGHRLWCDVSVQKPKTIETPKVVEAAEEPVLDKETVTSESSLEKSAERSQMIFPKIADFEHLPPSDAEEHTADSTMNRPEWMTPTIDCIDDFEICGEDETWAEDSDEGILTDEEYDILDASDEEYIDEQQKRTQK